MNNNSSLHLCHALSGEAKKAYNRKYYQKNKQYWVERTKTRPKTSDSVPKTPYDGSIREQAASYRGGIYSSLKSTRPDYEQLRLQENARLEILNRQRREQEAAEVRDAHRRAAKGAARRTPRAMVDAVSFKEIQDAKNRSAIETAARNVHKIIDSAVKSFKTSWQIGAADIIKAGRDIKKGWNSI